VSLLPGQGAFANDQVNRYFERRGRVVSRTGGGTTRSYPWDCFRSAKLELKQEGEGTCFTERKAVCLRKVLLFRREGRFRGKCLLFRKGRLAEGVLRWHTRGGKPGGWHRQSFLVRKSFRWWKENAADPERRFLTKITPKKKSGALGGPTAPYTLSEGNEISKGGKKWRTSKCICIKGSFLLSRKGCDKGKKGAATPPVRRVSSISEVLFKLVRGKSNNRKNGNLHEASLRKGGHKTPDFC